MSFFIFWSKTDNIHVKGSWSLQYLLESKELTCHRLFICVDMLRFYHFQACPIKHMQAFNAMKMYATGELELEESEKLYGLTQCTRDLSSSDCKKCLDDAISKLPNCCDGKEGGRVVGGSCNIRYEIYPFVNS
ncbi:unnamed protein product, partial [Vitis vinifera]